MIPRSLIALLLITVCVLLVSFAVLATGCAIAYGLHDLLGATALGWAAATCLLLCFVSIILLVIALGLNYLAETDSDKALPTQPSQANSRDAEAL